MNVFIAADMEGCTGVVTWNQCGSMNEGLYDWPFARRMMTHDVNAAIRGARRAGAKRIVVKDSHNTSKNLLIDELEPGVELISGAPGEGGMTAGLDSSFDAVFLVGYHGMAGTQAGVMEHTYTGAVHRFWINGEPAGEIGLSALQAGAHGVALRLIVSDDKGCAEAAEWAPGLAQAVTKHGMGRYMARLLHPSVTGPLIEDAAAAAMTAESPVRLPEAPLAMKIAFSRSEQADSAGLMPGWSRLDAYTIEQSFGEDFATAHRSVIRAFLAGAQASGR
jgi:D-amino peptidase